MDPRSRARARGKKGSDGASGGAPARASAPPGAPREGRAPSERGAPGGAARARGGEGDAAPPRDGATRRATAPHQRRGQRRARRARAAPSGGPPPPGAEAARERHDSRRRPRPARGGANADKPPGRAAATPRDPRHPAPQAEPAKTWTAAPAHGGARRRPRRHRQPRRRDQPVARSAPPRRASRQRAHAETEADVEPTRRRGGAAAPRPAPSATSRVQIVSSACSTPNSCARVVVCHQRVVASLCGPSMRAATIAHTRSRSRRARADQLRDQLLHGATHRLHVAVRARSNRLEQCAGRRQCSPRKIARSPRSASGSEDRFASVRCAPLAPYDSRSRYAGRERRFGTSYVMTWPLQDSRLHGHTGVTKPSRTVSYDRENKKN